ncbi:hypothetical protein BS78_07G219600 [Paspalum vaginatum]|nr:hypothetical protein BS78_07G219600 [Paspalum vaginatum]
MGNYHLSAKVTLREAHISFLLTVVYGPTRRNRNVAFLREIRELKPQAGVQWLILGDFNFVYKATDKNNNRLCPKLTTQIRDTLDGPSEIPLPNRKFTWSHQRSNPTMAKLDRFFCNEEWESTFSAHGLQALSSSLSDHYPLFLSNQSGPRKPKSFKFENFWLKLPGFKDVVANA